MSVALTAKQKAFVQEYLVDLNATQASRRAGYKNPEIGRQLLTNNSVSSAVQTALKAREKRTEVTQDYVIAKLREIVEKEASDGPDSELKYANKIGARYTMVIGDSELEAGKARLKDMDSGEEQEVAFDRLADVLMEKEASRLYGEIADAQFGLEELSGVLGQE